MQSECDIILINPCGATGESVRRSLEAGGVRVKLIEGPNPRKFEDYYIKVLKKAVEKTGARSIWPIFFPGHLAARRDEFPGVCIPLSDAGTIKLLDNKISSCALASKLGILQPRIYAGPDEVDRYPMVFKRPDGQGGDSVYFPGSRKALDNLMKTASEVLLTEFIEGTNVCVDVLRWDGFFYGAAYKVLWPLRKGVSRLRESIEAPELVETARRILEHVDYKGVCGVDFRVDPQGRAYFLECNPRFSGGIESAIASGFDIPLLYYKLAAGEKPDPSGIIFRPGTVTGEK